MRVVSIGDLVLDYYYKNEKLVGVNGGMSSHNIIANLALKGYDTAVFGTCGNDCAGNIAIKSLKDLNVDVTNVTLNNEINTRAFHVSYFDEENGLKFNSKKRCPLCNNKKWYNESQIDCDLILKNIKSNDILVFDNLNSKNQFIIDKTKNLKIIDLGQYFEFENINNEEIIKSICNKFAIINFNERVSNYLIKKMQLQNELELFKKLQPSFMSITKGEKGATFIYKDKIYNFTLNSIENSVDSTGAGDAFVSSIISDWILNDCQFNETLFSKWFLNSNKLTSKVVKKMSARGHINSLYKIKKINDKCVCEEFSLNVRKKIKRCNININNFETRIKNALNSTAFNNLEKIAFKKEDNCLFIGTGGSYAGALFASKVINELYGCNTYALYPRDVLYRNNMMINKVILFSYSGTTNDVIKSIQGFNKDNVYLITKGDVKKVSQKTNILEKNIISYRTNSNKGKERGFLSFEGAVAPASLFFKLFCESKKLNFNVMDELKNIISYWVNYLENIFANKELIGKIENEKMLNIFRGDFSDSACYDLESKIIESGIFNCIVHEKKNFSHGRFINYENLNNNFSIYFKQQNIDNYEKELLNYLGNNTVIIESQFNEIFAEFDLLIASQYIIYYFGKYLNIDVSKPDYSDNAMKIYFYKGELK